MCEYEVGRAGKQNISFCAVIGMCVRVCTQSAGREAPSYRSHRDPACVCVCVCVSVIQAVVHWMFCNSILGLYICMKYKQTGIIQF
jgi:hypothetical protein